MAYKSINDTSTVIRMTIVGDSRDIRMMIIGDATTWSVILMTLELSFSIIILSEIIFNLKLTTINIISASYNFLSMSHA
jgi:hypothetical protein